MARVTIIVLSWNGRALLRSCLRSICAQTATALETVVVDNGSSDGSADMVAAEFPAVRLLRCAQNEGFCGGNNRALPHCCGDLVLLLNNDAELHPRCVERLVAAADAHPEAGMFATRIMLHDRRDVFDSVGLLVYGDGVCRSRGWLEDDVGQYDAPCEVLGPNGCAGLYRRAMIEDVGFFDDRYFAYLEDLDLALRGQLRGWRCRYVPDAVVYHKKSMTGGYHSAFKALHVERNRIWNAVKLLPIGLLAASPVLTAIRYAAQGFAVLTGQGIGGACARDYSRWQLLQIVARAHTAALRGLPHAWRDRRRIQARRRLSPRAFAALLRRHHLPLRDLAFKD